MAVVAGRVPALSVALWFGGPWLDRALEHRFDRRCLRQRSRDFRGAARFRAGRSRACRRQQPSSQRRRPGRVGSGRLTRCRSISRKRPLPRPRPISWRPRPRPAASWERPAACDSACNMPSSRSIIRSRCCGPTWRRSNPKKATLALAQVTFDRDASLVATHAVSQEEFDQARSALRVAKAQVKQALEGVYQMRVSLGLPAIRPTART